MKAAFFWCCIIHFKLLGINSVESNFTDDLFGELIQSNSYQGFLTERGRYEDFLLVMPTKTEELLLLEQNSSFTDIGTNSSSKTRSQRKQRSAPGMQDECHLSSRKCFRKFLGEEYAKILRSRREILDFIAPNWLAASATNDKIFLRPFLLSNTAPLETFINRRLAGRLLKKWGRHRNKTVSELCGELVDKCAVDPDYEGENSDIDKKNGNILHYSIVCRNQGSWIAVLLWTFTSQFSLVHKEEVFKEDIRRQVIRSVERFMLSEYYFDFSAIAEEDDDKPLRKNFVSTGVLIQRLQSEPSCVSFSTNLSLTVSVAQDQEKCILPSCNFPREVCTRNSAFFANRFKCVPFDEKCMTEIVCKDANKKLFTCPRKCTRDCSSVYTNQSQQQCQLGKCGSPGCYCRNGLILANVSDSDSACLKDSQWACEKYFGTNSTQPEKKKCWSRKFPVRSPIKIDWMSTMLIAVALLDIVNMEVQSTIQIALENVNRQRKFKFTKVNLNPDIAVNKLQLIPCTICNLGFSLIYKIYYSDHGNSSLHWVTFSMKKQALTLLARGTANIGPFISYSVSFDSHTKNLYILRNDEWGNYNRPTNLLLDVISEEDFYSGREPKFTEIVGQEILYPESYFFAEKRQLHIFAASQMLPSGTNVSCTSICESRSYNILHRYVEFPSSEKHRFWSPWVQIPITNCCISTVSYGHSPNSNSNRYIDWFLWKTNSHQTVTTHIDKDYGDEIKTFSFFYRAHIEHYWFDTYKNQWNGPKTLKPIRKDQDHQISFNGNEFYIVAENEKNIQGRIRGDRYCKS